MPDNRFNIWVPSLNNATIAGTEELPIVQAGTTKKTTWNAISAFFGIALKLNIAAAQTTGVALTFLTDSVYGTIGSPETGNITYSAANAKLGVTNLIIHNNGSAPTFAANMKILSGSGTYATGVINYIFVQYINSTEVIYSINQRT